MTRQRRAILESTQSEPKGEGDANEEPKETIAGLQLLASEPSPKRRAPVVRKARATNSNGAIAQQEKRFARRTSEAAQAQLHAQVHPEVSTLIQVDATNQEVRRSGRTNDPPSAHPEPQRIMPQQGPAVGPPCCACERAALYARPAGLEKRKVWR